MRLSRKLLAVAAGAIVIITAAGGTLYHVVAAGAISKQEGFRETTVQSGDLNLTFSEEGTTQIAAEGQLMDFDVSAVTLTVEEVYVEAGASVEVGDALYKLTGESVEELTAYYEEAVSEAEKNLETAELNYDTGVLEAEYDLQSAKLDAETAADSYEASIGILTAEVEEKQQAYEEAVKKIQTYQTALDDGTYYVSAQINEKQEAVNNAASAAETAQTALTDAQSAYETARNTMAADMAELQTRIGNAAAYDELLVLVNQINTDYAAVQETSDSLTQAQALASQTKSAQEMAQTAFDSAVKDYDKNVSDANDKITELTESLERLQEAYEQAEREAVTKKADIQNEYDTAVLEGSYAQNTYESALRSLSSDVSSAQETLDELKEEQETLQQLQEGIICADRKGILASVTYEAEDVLYEDTAVVSYYDTDTILISVEVSQENIAKIAVGDSVEIAVSGTRDNVEGTVSSIAATATAGGGISNVSYAVVVSIPNAQGTLNSGSSTEVVFQYGTLENVFYIEKNAVSGITGDTGTVLLQKADGTTEEITVTIGESTDSFIVITEGISAGDVCLIETGGTEQ